MHIESIGFSFICESILSDREKDFILNTFKYFDISVSQLKHEITKNEIISVQSLFYGYDVSHCSLVNDQKDFDGSQYYERSKGAIVVPAWYGLSLKAGFAQNQGLYLNNQDQLPDGGLYQAGIALDASDGLWINKRMATLKQAKLLHPKHLL